MNAAAIKPRKFKMHFNRVNMQRGNPRVWTVHTSLACHQGIIVVCKVPVESVFRPDKPQPRAYFTGVGFVKQVGDTIVITSKQEATTRG